MNTKKITDAANIGQRKTTTKRTSRAYYSTLKRYLAIVCVIVVLLALMGAAGQTDYEATVKYERAKALYYQPGRVMVEIQK